MTKEKFSEGKWKVSKKRTKTGCYAKIDAPDWEDLARVVVRMSGDKHDCADGVANANLIAAAPEMYWTLKNIFEKGYVSNCAAAQVKEVLSKAVKQD